MSRLKDIHALLLSASGQLSKIEESYRLSLHKKLIESDLQILIKNYLENLRSVLDYAAKDISETILYRSKKEKVYFPVTYKNKTINNFKSLIGKFLPGLELKNKNIFNVLEKIQPYHTEYEWLADFMILTNDNKHQGLSSQEKKINSKLGLGNAIVAQNSKNIRLINCNINGVQVDDLTIDSDMDINKIDSRLNPWQTIWIEFVFTEIKKPALPFLKEILPKIKKIITDIYVFIT